MKSINIKSEKFLFFSTATTSRLGYLPSSSPEQRDSVLTQWKIIKWLLRSLNSRSPIGFPFYFVLRANHPSNLINSNDFLKSALNCFACCTVCSPFVRLTAQALSSKKESFVLEMRWVERQREIIFQSSLFWLSLPLT
jgi:hypothetical protein